MERATPAPLPAPAVNIPAFNTLRYEVEGPICFITLNRPQADNVVEATALRELPLAWEAYRADHALKVAIFRGAVPSRVRGLRGCFRS